MKNAFFLFSIAALATVDRLSKLWAEKNLSHGEIPIFGEFLRFKLAYNEGVAFSFPLTGVALKVVTVALIAYVAYYYFRVEKHRAGWVPAFYALVLAWAFWNAFDRILKGRVTDFIDLKYFAIFNVADMMITTWAILLFAFHAFYGRNSK